MSTIQTTGSSTGKEYFTAGRLLGYAIVAAAGLGIAAFGYQKTTSFFQERRVGGEIARYEMIASWPTCVLENEQVPIKETLAAHHYPIDTLAALYDLGQLNTRDLNIPRDGVGFARLLRTGNEDALTKLLPSLDATPDVLRVRGQANAGGVLCDLTRILKARSDKE